MSCKAFDVNKVTQRFLVVKCPLRLHYGQEEEVEEEQDKSVENAAEVMLQ